MVLTRRHRPGPSYRMLSERVLLGLLIPGAVLTTVLLVLYAYAAWNPLSRRHLDRVSFRLVVYALVAHLVFIIVFANSTLAPRPGGRCELLQFLSNFTLIFSAGMFFCVALNLPLVLAHIANGQRMEKYYVLGTLSISLAFTITPLASGRFGYASNMTCWYIDGDDLITWVIWTQIVPMLLTSAGEVVAFLTILGYLIAYELETRHFRGPVREITTGMSTARTTSAYASSSRSFPAATGSTILKFRHIIMRIGLYPLASCLLNISGSFLDLYALKHPPGAGDTLGLNLADLAIYCSRPLIYGLLAATDPSFLRALHALRHPELSSSFHVNGGAQPADSAYLSTVIEMSELDSELTMPPATTDKLKYPYPPSRSSHPPPPLLAPAEMRIEVALTVRETDEMCSDVMCQM